MDKKQDSHLKGKKGSFNISGVVIAVVVALIGFVLVYSIFGGFVSTLNTSSGQISNSGFPLASLFSTSGVVFIVLMAALLIGLITLAFKMIKGDGFGGGKY